MVRRMEAEPKLGLLQALPQVIGLSTLFGRMLQFSAAFYSPVFTRGVAALQGTEGPFWGHNALIRVRAFAESCGMGALTGKPPFGGHILSHDTVEAAMLARDGWTVRVDPDLEGSYEEAPANIVAYAKRDRRWCQGNLQHARLLIAPRFACGAGSRSCRASSPICPRRSGCCSSSPALPRRCLRRRRSISMRPHRSRCSRIRRRRRHWPCCSVWSRS
ncbi:glycosyltransferase family 2 protein [Pannonibacter sp. Pt2-lr]